MKAKKLLAILVSLCMLLVLVPAFTLMASADVTSITDVPAMKDGGTNYADMAAATLYAGNNGVMPVYDATAGTITMGTSSWGDHHGRAEFNLDGLTTTDDYVISFDMATSSGYLNIPTDVVWGWGIALNSSSGNGSYNKPMTGMQYFRISTNPYYCNVDATTGTDTITGTAIETSYTAFETTEGPAKIVIYADYDETTGTRDYHLFANDTFVYTAADQTATDPQLMVDGGRSMTYVLSNVVVYNPNEVVLAEVGEIKGETDWARVETTTVTMTNNDASGTVWDQTNGNFTFKHKNAGALTFSGMSLNDEFVGSFDMKWSTGSWASGGYYLQIGGVTVATVRKSNTSTTITEYDVALGAGPTNFWFHVYPNADDATLSDVDINIGGFKKQVTGLSLGSNPTVAMTQVNQVYGDTTTFTNWSIKNVDEDPFVFPTQGDAINLGEMSSLNLGSEPTTAGAYPAAPTYDASTNKISFPGCGGGRSVVSKDMSALNNSNYVVTYTTNNKGWSNGWSTYVFFAGDSIGRIGRYLQMNDRGLWYCDSTGESIVQTAIIGDSLNGATVKISVYVEREDDGTDTYYIITNSSKQTETFVVKNQTRLDATFYMHTADHGTSWTPTLSNVAIYEVDSANAYAVDVPNTLTGGTTSGSTTANYGETVTLTATANDGYTFLYWAIGNRTYTDAELAWTVKESIVATPVFADAAATDWTVTYRSKDGRVIGTVLVSELIAGTAEIPSVPARYGYTNGAWETIVPEEITSDTDVYPVYDKDTTEYTITVEGGTASKETAQFEDKITLTATVADFVAWTIDGKVVSTEAVYEYFVTGDVTITAVTAATDESAVTSLFVDGVVNADNAEKFRLTAIVNVHAAATDTFVEAGIVYSTTETDPEIGVGDTKKKVSSITEAGQFMYSLNNVPSTATVNVRGYMIVKTADGTLKTVYSASVAYTLPA